MVIELALAPLQDDVATGPGTRQRPAVIHADTRSWARARRPRNPKARAKASARSRSGFSNSSHARSVTLMVGSIERPLCSPRLGPCSLCRSACPSTAIKWLFLMSLSRGVRTLTMLVFTRRAHARRPLRGRRQCCRSRRCADLDVRGTKRWPYSRHNRGSSRTR